MILATAALLLIVIAAVGDPTIPGTSNILVQGGIFGGILVAFTGLILTGRLVPGKTHDRVVLEKDEAVKRANDLEASLRNDVLPVMTRFLDLQSELTLESHRNRRT